LIVTESVLEFIEFPSAAFGDSTQFGLKQQPGTQLHASLLFEGFPQFCSDSCLPSLHITLNISLPTLVFFHFEDSPSL
jgi:hypothetical protein